LGWLSICPRRGDRGIWEDIWRMEGMRRELAAITFGWTCSTTRRKLKGVHLGTEESAEKHGGIVEKEEEGLSGSTRRWEGVYTAKFDQKVWRGVRDLGGVHINGKRERKKKVRDRREKTEAWSRGRSGDSVSLTSMLRKK